MILHGLVDYLYRSHCMTMCSWVCTSALPHEHLKEEFGKNLWQYSPMGVCPVVMWVNWAHKELVNPMDRSHDPPFVYVGLMTYSFLSSQFRNDWSFYCSEMSKQPIRTQSLGLKCVELRCKKSLCWQTYSLLTNQSGTNNERTRDEMVVHRGHIQQALLLTG